VFSVFTTDEEVFANTQIWKNLLRRTCTEQLWAGERDGQRVEVWRRSVQHKGSAAIVHDGTWERGFHLMIMSI
jgi:hypothetical protein